MYTGRPGTGKTYLLVLEMIKKLNKGSVVYSNFYIRWSGSTRKIFDWRRFRFVTVVYPSSNLRSYSKINELMHVEKCIIAMDEAHFYLNSRTWKETTEKHFDFLKKLAQHRKDAIHIYGTVQNVKRIDVVMRELIDYWFVCTKGLFWIGRYEFDIDDDKEKKNPLSYRSYFLTKKRYQQYDTLQKI